ncbi:hypothetical protein [Methanolobus bombayensis]|uniref:hypothetical protein n=1 Tax=Methanolobus bombayensis TaxID=38023 RepID=UPI001AE57964|nr:hypothetical protein [Methanolobus bombayensis]MBP1908295.1 hypothetical protein [Methanolobus bombayensis]
MPLEKFDIDMSETSFTKGDARKIDTNNESDYTTTICLALPTNYDHYLEGDFEVNFKDNLLLVRILKVENQKLDPIYIFGKDVSIGTPSKEIPSLSFEHFTDNRGKYPYYYAEVVFPYLLAKWADSSHPTGMKMDYDYDKLQITGRLENEDKIETLIVLNTLFSSKDYGSSRIRLLYDDVTVFVENYFLKEDKVPFLQRVNLLSSKDAYQNAISDYFVEPSVQKSLDDLVHETKDINIENENDLLAIFMRIVNEVLIHHIEYRRWTSAFWDGERTIKENGQETKVPAHPKKETDIQPTLEVLFSMIMNPLGIHVFRETDEGVGSLDFKFAYTTEDKKAISLCAEFKLAHNKRIEKGLTRQLPAYMQANKSTTGAYIVMWFKDEDETYFKEPKNRDKNKMLEFVNETAKKIMTNEGLHIEIALIDASIKPSASNL